MTQKNVKLTDLMGNVLIPYTGIEVPTKTSQLTNDSGFLTTHQTIKQNGVTGATSNRYCTCTTAAATAAKTASITSGTFTLEAGAHVIVKFSNANTASNPTLNINGTGAKNIFHNGARITTDTNTALLAGAVDFVYDGTQWQLLGNYLNTITPDTKNTTGATDTNSKIFLVGATSQAANPQTYSHDTVFVDTDGALNSVTPAAGNNTTKVATTAFVTTALGSYVKKAGDTMTGALNFANNTWNNVGDDAAMGDCNVGGGHIGIKALNGSTCGFQFYNSGGTVLSQLNATSGNITSNGSLGINNNAAKMQYNSTTQAIEFVFA